MQLFDCAYKYKVLQSGQVNESTRQFIYTEPHSEAQAQELCFLILTAKNGAKTESQSIRSDG